MFGRLPSLPALRTFESAARLGSFKAAAVELVVSATAVSHQIRALEEQLDVPLFVRKTRKIDLTAVGEELAPVLTRTFLDIRNALEAITSEEAVITVSTSPSFATLWLVPRLLDFYAKYPKHCVQLDTTTRVINLKQDRRVDVAIRYGQSLHDGLNATPLFDETFGAYLSPSLFPHDQKLEDLTLIETAWQQDVLADISWNHWLKAANINSTNPTIVQFDEEEHVLQAAIAGQGVALASSILAADCVNRNLLIPYRGEIQLKGAVYTALCLPERRSVKKVDIFLDWLSSSRLSHADDSS